MKKKTKKKTENFVYIYSVFITASKEEIAFEKLKKLSKKEILKLIKLEFPNEEKEYENRLFTSLGSITDYGNWKQWLITQLKEGKITKENYREDFLNYFKEKFNSDTHHTGNLFYNGKLAVSIHVLLRSNGYSFQPYFGEGKRLTLEEKIIYLKAKLSKPTLTVIEEHFDQDNLDRILKGRKGGVKTVKPKDDGLNYYIWRITRFNLGVDPTLPVTAEWEIRSFLEDHIPGITDKEIKVALELCDLLLFVKNQKDHGKVAYSGAIAWANALGF
jgi:hypothetical protein